MLKFCPYCGAEILRQDVAFCMTCGKSFAEFMNAAKSPKQPSPSDSSLRILLFVAFTED